MDLDHSEAYMHRSHTAKFEEFRDGHIELVCDCGDVIAQWDSPKPKHEATYFRMGEPLKVGDRHVDKHIAGFALDEKSAQAEVNRFVNSGQTGDLFMHPIESGKKLEWAIAIKLEA